MKLLITQNLLHSVLLDVLESRGIVVSVSVWVVMRVCSMHDLCTSFVYLRRKSHGVTW